MVRTFVMLQVLQLIFFQLQLTLTLDGQTAHYVELLDSPSTDETTNRITCPVYSIRPANRTMKFLKYVASEDQFNTVTAWDNQENATTFRQCADIAAAEGAFMFLFDGTCQTSKKIFKRLTEPCADEQATLVYMADNSIPEDYCFGENVVSAPGDTLLTSCGKNYDVTLTCEKGVFRSRSVGGRRLGILMILGDACFYTTIDNGITHDKQATVCAKTCQPKSDSERLTFQQNMKQMVDYLVEENLQSKMRVDCRTNVSNRFVTVKWANGLLQPSGTVNMWKEDFPSVLTDPQYCYMEPAGLWLTTNNRDHSTVCCYDDDQ